MRNLGSQRSHSQKEGEEVTREKESKREKIKIKRLFCLEKCGKTEEIFTGNETPQSIKIEHMAMLCAMPPLSHQCRAEPQAPQPKKKRGGEGADIYIYIYIYIYTHVNI